MKITRHQLRRIIREQLEAIEQDVPTYDKRVNVVRKSGGAPIDNFAKFYPEDVVTIAKKIKPWHTPGSKHHDRWKEAARSSICARLIGVDWKAFRDNPETCTDRYDAAGGFDKVMELDKIMDQVLTEQEELLDRLKEIDPTYEKKIYDLMVSDWFQALELLRSLE